MRREFEPSFDEDSSPGYVRLEGELVWLDPELVESASHEFASLTLGPADRALDAIRLYRGQFAPEFEYEDWAMATRDSLHAAFLDLVDRTIRRLAVSGDWARAAEVGRHALAVDPSAEEIERSLIALYHESGSHAAAAEQYAHFAATQRSELGVEPPPLATIVSALDRT
jgi:two-component SAPR family response regulator